MRAKVTKCHSLALQATSGKVYDPKLNLQGGSIPFIGNNAIKFLGTFIKIPPNQHQMRENVKSKLVSLLEKVDRVPVTRNQKLLLYKAAVCPRIIWSLGITDLPISWVTKELEAVSTRYLKKWSGLACSANPSRLYLPWQHGGLDLPNIRTLHKTIKVKNACQLLMSNDLTTQQVTKLNLLGEEAQKRTSFSRLCSSRSVSCRPWS